MSTEIAETDLLRRSVDGDVGAFEELVRRHRDKAYRYAVSIVRDHHDAEEAAQDAFVRAFRAIKRFDVSRPFTPWLFRIVRNLCFNRLSERKRRADLPMRDEEETVLRVIPSDDASPEELAERQDQVAELSASLGALSEEHREIVLLRHAEGLAYEEMAEVLGIPVGTVMSRLFHARRNLSKALRAIRARE